MTQATGSTPRRAPRSDAVRNRERVLVAAREVFAETGLESQMPAVAKRAGVGVGTVYRHFPTKEALIEAIMRERVLDYEAVARRALDNPDAGVAFVQLVKECAGMQVTDCALRDISARRGEMVERVEKDMTELFGLLTQVVERAQDAQALRADVVPQDLPILLAGLAPAMMASTADNPVWERYLTILLDGLRCPDATPLPARPPAIEEMQQIMKSSKG